MRIVLVRLNAARSEVSNCSHQIYISTKGLVFLKFRYGSAHTRHFCCVCVTDLEKACTVTVVLLFILFAFLYNSAGIQPTDLITANFSTESPHLLYAL